MSKLQPRASLLLAPPAYLGTPGLPVVNHLARRLGPQTPSHTSHLKGAPGSSPPSRSHSIQNPQREIHILDQLRGIEIDPHPLSQADRLPIGKLRAREAPRRVIVIDDPPRSRNAISAVYPGRDAVAEAPKERVLRCGGGEGQTALGEGHLDAEVAGSYGGGGGGGHGDDEVGEGDGDAAALAADGEGEGCAVGTTVAGEFDDVGDAGGGGLAGGEEITGGLDGRTVVEFGGGGGEGGGGGSEEGGEEGEEGGGEELHGG